jgi:hypothetical protein
MNIIDHGVWTRYTPEKPQADAPPNAIYAKRDDGVDWYDYVRPNFLLAQPPKPKEYHAVTGAELVNDKPAPRPNFKPGSVVCNIYYHPQHDRHLVGAATRDPTAIHAINQRVIEITDYQGNDEQAQKELGGRIYDHVKKAFGEKPQFQPPPPSPIEQKILEALDAVIERLEKLEKR